MIHKEGRVSVLTTLFVFAVIICIIFLSFGFRIIPIILAVALLVLFCFIAFFFRDPHREVAAGSANDILSSADGKVVIIKEVEENEFLRERTIQVSVFMSVFNVHINYYPIGGRVIYSNYHIGKYLLAWHPKSSEKNERTSIAIQTENGTKILVRQIAGYVARRIVCYAKQNDLVSTGQQMGFIKFGSRVDFFLPLDSEILVKEGDKVKACQTVIARLK
ncbi:MAG: phosphatidylserine decarboxylase family protein [Bacteroidales bacterium]|nr:phosphatidylserine decarboxylase family protein [Bacteroidales bacterium]